MSDASENQQEVQSLLPLIRPPFATKFTFGDPVADEAARRAITIIIGTLPCPDYSAPMQADDLLEIARLSPPLHTLAVAGLLIAANRISPGQPTAIPRDSIYYGEQIASYAHKITSQLHKSGAIDNAGLFPARLKQGDYADEELDSLAMSVDKTQIIITGLLRAQSLAVQASFNSVRTFNPHEWKNIFSCGIELSCFLFPGSDAEQHILAGMKTIMAEHKDGNRDWFKAQLYGLPRDSEAQPAFADFRAEGLQALRTPWQRVKVTLGGLQQKGRALFRPAVDHDRVRIAENRGKQPEKPPSFSG